MSNPPLVSVRWIAAPLMFLAAVPLVSCARLGSSLPPIRAERVMYQWHDDGRPGPVSITISLTDQIADIQRGDRHIGWCYVATGKEGHGTPSGNYKITEKIEDKYSNKYGWIEDEFGVVVDGDAKVGDRIPEGCTYVAAPMPFWMRLTASGIGMHGGLIPEPGKPASHGCIRLPKEFVPILFEEVKIGTPVTITRAKRKSFVPTTPDAAPRMADVAPPGPTATGTYPDPLAPRPLRRRILTY